MRLPFTKSVKGDVGGGLIFKDTLQAALRTPSSEQWLPPRQLENAAFLTPLENQGYNPWCAAYTMMSVLAASRWMATGQIVEFSERICYEKSKAIDGIAGDGTTLTAVISVAQNVDCSGGKAPVPRIKPFLITSLDDFKFGIHHCGFVLAGFRITEGWKYIDGKGRIGSDRRPLGGHAITGTGFSDKQRSTTFGNWWGTSVGLGGFVKLTYDEFDEQFMTGYGLRVAWPDVEAV